MTSKRLRPLLAAAAALMVSVAVWGADDALGGGAEETFGPGPMCCAG